MVKADLITGFLGSGKTTFIQRYARHLMQKGDKVGIIENDYGSVNVDMMLLQDLEKEGALTEMVVGGDLGCYRRRFRTKLITMGMEGLDRVLVEPSGIYDVDEFFDALCEDPVSSLCRAGNAIAIIDPDLETPMGRYADYLLTSQLADAGVVLFSHFTGTEEEIGRAGKTIRYINGAMEKFGCRRRFDDTYDPERGTFGQDIIAKDWKKLDEADYEKIASCGYQEYDHIKLQAESQNGFSSLYYMNTGKNGESLRKAAADLLGSRQAGRIYRIKGFYQENGRWHELNATRRLMEDRPIGEGQDVLIVIGEGVDKDQVDRIIGAKHI